MSGGVVKPKMGPKEQAYYADRQAIQKDFDASLSSLEWTVNAYTLTFAVLLVTGGRLGDLFGRRRMFLFGVVVFALASATIGFAPTEGWLVASRAIQAIAILGFSGSSLLLRDVVE